MIGLVIVTHGRLAEEFVHAMEHVVGPQAAVSAICIGPDDDMERRRRDILAACQKVNDGGGVILLTDMFGGTPSNLAISVMEQTKAEVIAGLNLPMLIKLASVRRREDLPTCVAQAQEAGPQVYLGRLLRAVGREIAAMTAEASVEITNERGLHARASAKFVKLAAHLRRRGDRHQGRRDRRRPLDHGPDDAGRRPRHIAIRAEGAEAQAAVDALAELVTNRFEEDR